MALTRPFAQNGDKLAIPETASDSSVSYNLGFTYAYALPPEEGGKFIDRAQFNQLMYDTTSQVLENKTAIATKANASATVNLSGNQNINGVKTFSAPPVSATNPTNNNQVANKAYVDSVGNTAVKLTGNQTINGTKTFNNNIVSPNITAMQNNLNTIFSSTTSPVKTQTTTKVITVGTSGDFADLPSAFKEARNYTSAVTIRLVSNLNITSSIAILYLNGAHITLDFNNFKIINTNANILALLNFTGCHIGAIIDINLQNVCFMAFGGTILSTQGNITITNTNTSADYDCIRSWFGSTIAIADNTTFTLTHVNTRSSFYSSVGSIIGIGGGSTINDNSADGILLNVYRGGIIQTTATTINTSIPISNQAANTPTVNGIIFGNYSL